MPKAKGASAPQRLWNELSAARVRVGLALLAAVLAVSMAWVLQLALRRADQLALAREEQLAANGLRVHEARLQQELNTETVWDDAVQNLDLHWSDTWAQANMVQWETSTFQLVRVLDGTDRAVLRHARDGAPTAGPEIARVDAALARRIRAREFVRGPFAPRRAPSRTVLASPIEESTAAVIGGRLYLFTASLVQPDFGSRLPHARAPIVVAGQLIDEPVLKQLSDVLLLRGLMLIPGATPPGRGLAQIAVRDADGRPQAWLAWRAQTPAVALVRALAWPAAGCGALLGLAVIVVGVSEARYRRRLQAERDRAEAASDAKSRFLANVSHEIRTPLNGVMGMAQLLGQGELTAEQRDQLDIILRSGKMLTAVLNDVLDISKVEAGQMRLDPHEFDLADCFETACRPFAELAREKGLAFEIDLAAEVGGAWLGDEARIRQILSNLCANAVKFTETGRVRVAVVRRDGGLEVRVADTGIGIPADRLPSLFREFSQVDASTTRVYGGTGLGLAISRRLAGLMGGELTVESRFGEGSVFQLWLPIRRLGAAPAARDPARTGADAPAAWLRILAADDNEVNRRILQAVLTPLCAELALVADGAEAVAAFGGGGFDLVLMDIQMPRQDGMAATRAIRELERRNGWRRTPILALTANVMTEQLRDYAEAGMDGCIGKPIDFKQLFAALARVGTPGEAHEAAPRLATPAC